MTNKKTFESCFLNLPSEDVLTGACVQETVGVFLSHPSVKDEPDLEGRTAFMWAAGKGSDDVIRTMLALTPHIDINMADKYGGTGEGSQSTADTPGASNRL